MRTPMQAAMTREEIQAERARWMPGGRERPATRQRPAARVRLARAEAVSPVLPFVRGGGEAAARPWSAADYGSPSVAHRVNGFPLEIRVWIRRPPGVGEAIYHPSGVWIAVRLLDR